MESMSYNGIDTIIRNIVSLEMSPREFGQVEVENILELIQELFSVHSFMTKIMIDYLVKSVLLDFRSLVVSLSTDHMDILSLRQFIIQKLLSMHSYRETFIVPTEFDENSMTDHLVGSSQFGSFSIGIYLDIASYFNYRFQNESCPEMFVFETFFTIIIEKTDLFKALVRYIQFLKRIFDLNFGQYDSVSGVFSDIYISKYIILKVVCSDNYTSMNQDFMKQMSDEVSSEISADELNHKEFCLINLFCNKIFRFSASAEQPANESIAGFRNSRQSTPTYDWRSNLWRRQYSSIQDEILRAMGSTISWERPTRDEDCFYYFLPMNEYLNNHRNNNYSDE